MIMDEFVGAATVILFSWTSVLLWATWQIHRVAKQLDTEREELRRWQRLHALAQRQNVRWQ